MKLKLILLSVLVALNAVVLEGCADRNTSDDEKQSYDAAATEKSLPEANFSEDFEYEQYEDDTGTAIMITDYTDSAAEVVIPKEIEGLPARKIGKGSFKNNIEVAFVTIPDSVTEIGLSAFSNCPDLTIQCPSSSYAEQYAVENEIPYTVI